MKRKIIYYLFSIFILNNNISSQEIISPRNAFYFGFKVNRIYASDYLSSPTYKFQWGEVYASYFDNENYKKAVNDEFKRVPFLTKYFRELNDGSNGVDLNKTFYFNINTSLGTYDASCSCFPLNSKDLLNYSPLLFEVKEIGNNKLWYDNSFFKLKIGRYFNFNDFDYSLKIKVSDAEKLIESRKNNYGTINRNIILKITYNIVDQKFNNDNNVTYYVGVYLHKIEYYDGIKLLGQSLPRYNYFDKVKLIKLKDGVDKIYYDKDWKELNFKDSNYAVYYRVKNYKDGLLVDGIVTDYYSNGMKQMEGKYLANGSVADGLFIWYYSNGQKSEEITYTQGIRNGKYRAWFENGRKKEEVMFINDKKDGCDFLWDIQGRCENRFEGYHTVYKNGEVDFYNRKCPCDSNN